MCCYERQNDQEAKKDMNEKKHAAMTSALNKKQTKLLIKWNMMLRKETIININLCFKKARF